jgi:ArsR family transcriptional regulator, arsenate/arsenite/antimonite-responsive transcriptional repressor
MKETLEVLDRQRGVCCDIEGVPDPSVADRAARQLRAIADATRLSMLMSLRQTSQPVCICDFTVAFDLSQPTISHHMARLREAGLVNVQREGIWAFYSLVSPLPAPVSAVLEALG